MSIHARNDDLIYKYLVSKCNMAFYLSRIPTASCWLDPTCGLQSVVPEVFRMARYGERRPSKTSDPWGFCTNHQQYPWSPHDVYPQHMDSNSPQSFRTLQSRGIAAHPCGQRGTSCADRRGKRWHQYDARQSGARRTQGVRYGGRCRHRDGNMIEEFQSFATMEMLLGRHS